MGTIVGLSVTVCSQGLFLVIVQWTEAFTERESGLWRNNCWHPHKTVKLLIPFPCFPALFVLEKNNNLEYNVMNHNEMSRFLYEYKKST